MNLVKLTKAKRGSLSELER